MPSISTASFPTDLAGLAEGGPVFRNIITTSRAGTEQRALLGGIHPLREFSINISPLEASASASVYNFFDDRQGMYQSFRFKDPFDYEALACPLFHLGGTSYQLLKLYSLFGLSYYRPIVKPINGTLSFDGGSGISVNYETGVVTSGSAPLSWTGEFEIEARLSEDSMALILNGGDLSGFRLGIREVFDTPLPVVTSQAAIPSPLNTEGTAITLKMGIGMETTYYRATNVISSTGLIEERYAEWAATNLIMTGDWQCGTSAQKDTLLALFLLARGRRNKFWYSTFGQCRFGSDRLTLRRSKPAWSTILGSLSLIRYTPGTGLPY